MEKISFLQASSLFADLPLEEIYQIVMLSEVEFVRAGAEVVREGDPGNKLFVVLTGRLEVIKGTGQKSVQLAVLESGEFFGEMALIDDAPRVASVFALEDVSLLSLEWIQLEQVLLQNTNITLNMMRVLAQRLREM